uniref:Uncharacterized protein n=1 Tax=Arundo donax TaxID=35708 RepID=A0A0A9HTC4_ARUDO
MTSESHTPGSHIAGDVGFKKQIITRKIEEQDKFWIKSE